MTEQHTHEHDGEDTYGLALGFRVFEDEGKLYLAEAEIAPYVDEQDELGATLVFHSLSDIDPASALEEMEGPVWSYDFDDELKRDTGDSVPAQFQAIARQLSELSVDQLREYLKRAQEEETEE